MNRISQLHLPPSTSSQNAPNPLDVNGGAVVITGANGSGKTRMGAWLELDSPLRNKVHRIAAQKSLAVPRSASTYSFEDALDALRYGTNGAQIGQLRDKNQYSDNFLLTNKRGWRWSNNPNVSMLNDFQQLMDALHSDAYETSTRYLSTSRATADKVTAPETKLMRVKRLWEQVLPHRVLDVSSINIKAKIPGSLTAYEAGAMSDGERAAFYLLAQCIVAPAGSVIVIDEPELHIHRSIQGPLFDSVEAERSDCLFVYITHDLDFAASRVGATTLWLKSYDGQNGWDWELVPEQEGVPEQMLLSVLGSRKKVLLTEGDRGSLDYAIYSRAYPERTVIPVGGCSDVLAATKVLQSMPPVHHLEPAGLIDRDYRDDSNAAALRTRGVQVLEVHEVEQVLLTEAVLEAVARSLSRDDALSIVEAVKSIVFNRVKTNFELAVARLAASRVQLLLANFDLRVRDESALTIEFSRITSEADPTTVHAAAEQELRDALNNADYRATLRLYSDKGLIIEAGKQFGFAGTHYVEHVKRLISRQDDFGVIAAIQGELPAIV